MTAFSAVNEKTCSDTHVLQAIAQGQQSALAALYDRYASQMLGLARRILSDTNDAEDLVHDVFVEIWQKAHTYDPNRASVRSWLLLRVRSRAIDRLRSLTIVRHHATTQITPEQAAQPRCCEPDHLTEHYRLYQTLNCLSAAQRSVVELSYFQGLSHSEIADRCGIPNGTVKSRLAAATTRLRVQLAADAVAPLRNGGRSVRGSAGVGFAIPKSSN